MQTQDKPESIQVMDKEDKHQQDQNTNIHVGGDVKGDIHADRHDTHVDQSVKDVTAKGDAVIATGDAKITLIKVIPSWVWIVMFLAIFGGVGGFWTYRYFERKRLKKEQELEIEKLKRDLKFNSGEIGILVANFTPPEGSTKETENRGEDFAKDLCYRLIKDVEVVGEDEFGVEVRVKYIDPKIRPHIDNESDAEKIGKTNNAKLVVWGYVNTELDTYPFIQPIKSKDESYDLRLTLIDRLDTIGYKIVAETVKQDVQKLVSFILGHIYYVQSEELEDAIESFQNALGMENEKNDAYAHFYLGNAYYFSGKKQEAETQYQQAVELKASFMEAWNNLGVLTLNQYRIDEALDHFRKADRYGKCSKQIEEQQESSLNPGCVHLLHNLANVYLEKGEYAMATEYYERSIKAFEEFQEDFIESFLVQLYNDTAYSYIERGKEKQYSSYYERAKEYLTKVENILETEPSLLSLQELKSGKGALKRNWGRMYIGLKNWESALNHLKESKTFDPENPIVHLLLAQLYNGRCQQGDKVQYIKEIEYYFEKMINEGKYPEAKVKLSTLKETCKY